MRSTANVLAIEHSFGIVDHGQTATEMPDWTTGLIGALPVGAMIYTGIHSGHVRVTADVLIEEPGQIDPGPWDDVVEASLHAHPGQLAIHSLEYRPGGTPPALPILTPNGPGTYRLRAHVRGRDRRYDAILTDDDEPTEDYLVSIWPAAPAPPLIVKATDWCGYSLRAANLATQPRPNAPSTPRSTKPGNVYENRLRQAQRETAARRPGTWEKD